ncbi:hypothetical protein DC498_01395 [Terrimonas sp.]|uniref:hypothetical protein n=1 Tax=Terrimonas sp. TaxID=1914338 RepID=UPI000D521C9E|nr:hypothetical protein [Terrimonas sp.]PVD54074.1 hypothetical protein DC498_01395 [Terrimonas sp.]
MKFFVERVCISMLIVFFLPALFVSCKKEKKQADDAPLVITPLVRPSGISTGVAVTKIIGTSGGTIRSADGSLLIVIPAGALDINTTITVEPITNTNIAGIGSAFRLTPHGKIFSKPVTITWAWAAHADSIGLLQTLGLAYQMDDGVWKFTGADSFDANNKTVSFSTTHFSDWSLMNRISLTPYKASIDVGDKQTINALVFTEVDMDNLLVPLVNDPDGPYNDSGYPVGTPAPLPYRFIKSWKLTGAGSIAEISKHAVRYQSPASVNGTTSATVTLQLNAPVPGTFLLVSNITIMGDGWIELSIDGGSPVRFPASPVVKMGTQYILSNPEDEGGGHFLLTWDGGLGSHAFDLDAGGTRFHFLTGINEGYNSMYIPGANMPPQASEGNVNITKLSAGKAEGAFNISNVGVGDKFKPEATAQGKFSARLFIP